MKDSGFNNFQLSGELLRAIGLLNYTNPTKVQEKVIPAVMSLKDIIVKSRTGSGKTAAFAIPVCELADWDENKPQALVITPTRELAIQVSEDFFNIGRFKRIKVASLYGKSPFYAQQTALKQKTHVVVGTPGRINDHLDRGTLDTSAVKFLVIDEADELLDMGFIDQLEAIISCLPKDRVTMLFSATMPADIKALCNKYMRAPLKVEIEEKNLAADRILQELFEVDRKDKLQLLKDILVAENPDSCIIFCNTKVMVDELYESLTELRGTCRKLHGGMEQEDRLKVINGFRKGSFRYLTATDVAARGIDIDNITLVINYDIPEDGETYVHRIGRTGRMDREGKAITFVAPDEDKYLDNILHYTGKKIAVREKPLPELIESLRQEFESKIASVPEMKAEKGAHLSTDIMKLHINAGKKTKMRPSDIVGTLCNIDGMTADDIGIINIADVSSFVEILNNKGGLVLGALQNMPIKGRLRKVSRVDMARGR